MKKKKCCFEYTCERCRAVIKESEFYFEAKDERTIFCTVRYCCKCAEHILEENN